MPPLLRLLPAAPLALLCCCCCLLAAGAVAMEMAGGDGSTDTPKAPSYKSLGCYRDSGRRDLPLQVEVKATNNYRCRDRCRRLKYRYAGNQYSNYCFCGNNYGRYGKAADSDCPMKCNANKEQICGGGWHQNVYTTGVGRAALAIKTLGCYADKGQRDLPFLSGGLIDVNSCIKRCGDLGYRYAGLQSGSQCWCGATYGKYGKTPDAECGVPCASNPQQLCGGPWHSLIYETDFRPASHHRQNLGCYIDQGARDMHEYHPGTISIEYCIRYCHRLGYKYAAVQYSSVCFCGNKYGRYGKGAASTCNMACNGKKDEICGGGWRNNVYATGREAERFISLGCFNDKGVRDLPWLAKTGAITLNNCRLQCASHGYLYFGVQYSNYCFCGNSYGRYGKAARSSLCSRPCVGNKEQICGGNLVQNIYATHVRAYYGSDSGHSSQSASDERERALNQRSASDTIGKLVTISQVQMRSYGCFRDNADRDLPDKVFVGTLSVHYCRWACRRLKYRYFGLQAGNHCFCGNSFGHYGQGADSRCQYKCAANSDQICGGSWYNRLYASGISARHAEMKPLGCYVDKGQRDLPLMGSHCPTISVNTCVKTCSDLGYKYAGAQAGSQCFCGDTYGRYGKAKDSLCYIRCHANRRQMCGGSWHQHIYETKADIKVPHSIGCYKDQGVRDLVELAKAGMMSINYCRKLCRNLGYRYAGLQYASYCFCGNKYGRYGKATAESNCNTKCSGHHDQICGGGWHNSVFESGRPAFAFKSFGCFNDKVVRDLPFLGKIGAVTLNNCRQRCWRYGFRYFGVQNGDRCFCGDSYGKYGKVPDVRCQKRCLGNRDQICGDTWLQNIYDTGLGGYDESEYGRESDHNENSETGENDKSKEHDKNEEDKSKEHDKNEENEESTIINGKTDTDFSMNKETGGTVDETPTHHGCYKSRADRPDLPDLVFTGTVTIQRCVRMCADRLYRFAGLQGGIQCFCGNKYGRQGKADKASSCSARCSGNAQQICGGKGFVSVYSTAVSWKISSKGCFIDKAVRDLPVLVMSGAISVNRCLKRCQRLGYYYAGVQNAMQCFCGNTYNRYGKADSAKCNLKCRGNREQVCGGTWFQNIYRTNFRKSGRKAIGCYKDSAKNADLPDLVKTGTVSVNLCIRLCAELGYKYAGVQGGNKCYCGDNYGRHGKVDASTCTTVCSGNANQMCGAAGYSMVYKTGASASFHRVGCYKDKKNARALPFRAVMEEVSLHRCKAECSTYGFLYFGVENGDECWCGNRYSRHGKATNQDDCNVKCSGNARQICGGSSTLSVYTTGLSRHSLIISEGINESESVRGDDTDEIIGGDISSTSHTSTSTTTVTERGTTVISYKFIWTVVGTEAMDHLGFGCFRDTAERDLPTHAATSASMSIKSCVKLCQDRQFKFAGLQSGNECWCGKQFGRYGQADDSRCDKACSGEAAKKCGGSWYNSVYTTSLEDLQDVTSEVISTTPIHHTETKTITTKVTTTETGPEKHDESPGSAHHSQHL